MNDVIYFLKHGEKQPARLNRKKQFTEEYRKQINEVIILMICFVILMFLIF